MEKSLDELLSDNAGDEAAVPETPAIDQQPEAAPLRDDQGRFAAQEGVEQAPAVEPVAEAGPPPAEQSGLPKDVYEPLRAVRDENKALKEQLEALSRQIESFRQQPEEPEVPPSIWEDEQGWQTHFGGQVVSQAVEQARYHSKLTTSEIMARQAFGDFGEVWQPMNEFLRQNPVVAQQATADPHPWGFAYRAYKNQQTMAQLGAVDVADLETKMREKIMAEMQAQLPPVTAPTIPPSLTGERNVGARSGPAWAGAKPLDELLR